MNGFLNRKVSRRQALRIGGVSLLAGASTGWFGGLACHVAAAAAAQKVKPKACILLWMAGGPSQVHTFDLKEGGPIKGAKTSVPGITITEHLPKLAEQMKHLVLLRGMSTRESNHSEGTYLMHTGYPSRAGGVKYPGLGSIVSARLGNPESSLPNSIVIGADAQGLVSNFSFSGATMGPQHNSLKLSDPGKGISNLKATIDPSTFDAQADLLRSMNAAFSKEYGATSIQAQEAGYAQALRLMKSSEAAAFNLELEPTAGRSLYGDSLFGKGCLLARRLLDVGVPFIEVVLDGWDTHTTPAKTNDRCQELDRPFASLITDLKDRGRLDDTLIVWMGEFGRTPLSGNNHFARAWTTVLAGGGLKTGQVVGRTDKTGATVEDRPVPAKDFMATICQGLGINHTKQYTFKGRPHTLVEAGAVPIAEVLP